MPEIRASVNDTQRLGLGLGPRPSPGVGTTRPDETMQQALQNDREPGHPIPRGGFQACVQRMKIMDGDEDMIRLKIE